MYSWTSIHLYVRPTRLISLGVPNNPMWFITVVSSPPWLSFTKIWNIMYSTHNGCKYAEDSMQVYLLPCTFTYCYAVHSLKFNKLQGENCVFLDIFFRQTRSKLKSSQYNCTQCNGVRDSYFKSA